MPVIARHRFIAASHSRIGGALLLTASCLISMTSGAAANSEVAEFYRGKSVYLVIGAAAGAGFDAYARLVARHLGKHIPGNPSVIPQNLDGGGGFRASMRVAVTAPPDGTHIGAVLPTTLLDPIIGDPRKRLERLDLAFLGSASKNLQACFARVDAPVKSAAELFERELVVGAGNSSSTSREFAAVFKNVLGAKLKIAAGYTGNGQIYMAVDRGEVQGMCGTSYVGLSSLRGNWLRDNFARPLVQESIHGHPALNAMGVPRTLMFAKTDEQRQMLELYYSQQEFGRPYIVSAKTPPDRLQALQKAFMDTLRDAELLRDAATTGLEIDPTPGPDVDALVAKAYASSPHVQAKLRQALEYAH